MQEQYSINSSVTALNGTQVLTNKSISYDGLTGTPAIPTNMSELTNDSGFDTANTTYAMNWININWNSI